MVVLTIPSESAYTMRLGRSDGHEWVVQVTYSNFRRPTRYAATPAGLMELPTTTPFEEYLQIARKPSPGVPAVVHWTMNGLTVPLVGYLFPKLDAQTIVLLKPDSITHLRLPFPDGCLITEARSSEDGLTGCALAFSMDLEKPTGAIAFFDLD